MVDNYWYLKSGGGFNPLLHAPLQWIKLHSMQRSSLESECSNVGVIIDPGCAEDTATVTAYTFTEYCSNLILVSFLHARILLLHCLQTEPIYVVWLQFLLHSPRR